MSRTIMVFAALTSLLFILPITAHAGTITVDRDLAFIDNRPLDDIFGKPGLNLNLTILATDTAGSDALAGGVVTALPSNVEFPISTPVSVNLNTVFPITSGAEFTRFVPIGVSDLSKVTGTYTYTVTDTSGDSIQSTSHYLDKLEVIPLPTDLAFSDQSTTPVFTFTDPDPTPYTDDLLRRYVVHIFDGTTKINIFTSDSLLTPSFTVPDGILEFGMPYYFRAISWDYDITETDFAIHSRGENRAMDYALFQPVPEPPKLLLLGSGLVGLVGFGRRKFRK